MKKNLEILEIEPKLTKDEKKYWRVKTSEGWMSCFDSVASGKLKDFIGKTACVEVAQSGDFQNIKKCYGEADKALDEINKEFYERYPDEKPEVVKMGLTQVEHEKAHTKNNHATMYTSYAKDIFCALCEIVDKETMVTNDEVMKEAIRIVKQAKEAFE